MTRPSGMRGSTRMRTAAALAAAVVSVVLTGCTDSAGPAPISLGDGVTAQEFATPKAVTFSGTTATGSRFDSTSALGHVLVVNFWYASCGPCNAEAAGISALSKSLAAEGVEFVGVNVRDGSYDALNYDTKYKITYPTILDVKSGAVQLAFARTGAAQANVIPTTVIIDPKGQATSRISSQVTSIPVLKSLIETARTGKRQ